MKTTILDNIYKEIEEKFQLGVLENRRVLNSFFEFTNEVIEEGKDTGILMTGLGSFCVKKHRRSNKETILKDYEERRRNKSSEQ